MDFPMKIANRSWRLSSVILAVTGVILIGMGLYFVLLRPPLLPEDMRYMSVSAAQIEALGQGLSGWLDRVFDVMGGYVIATGVLTTALAATSFRARDPFAVVGVVVAGIASIAWMSAVNFIIGSDFKWFLLAIALLWASSVGFFWLERRGLRSGSI
jgi:hypothetical protein